MEAAHPAEADDGDAHRRVTRRAERTARVCPAMGDVTTTGSCRRARCRADRPDARRPARPPGAGRDARDGLRRHPAAAEQVAAGARRPGAALGQRAPRPTTTSTPWPSAPAPTPTSSCSSPRRRRARRSSARSRSRSTSPRSTGRSPPSTPPAPACRSASTAASIRPTGSCATPSPRGTLGAAAPRAHLQPRPGAAADRRTSRMSGGIFLDMTCHDIDMARFVTGSEVVEVYAQRRRPRRPGDRRGGRPRHGGADDAPRRRLPDGHRQQPACGVRLRPARRGVRRRRAWPARRTRPPTPARC